MTDRGRRHEKGKSHLVVAEGNDVLEVDRLCLRDRGADLYFMRLAARSALARLLPVLRLGGHCRSVLVQPGALVRESLCLVSNHRLDYAVRVPRPRHPLYSSLLLLVWGIFFKRPSWPGGGLAAFASACLLLTARAEEAECIRFFGPDYDAYIKRTRRFIPFVL